jgi:predicted ATPase
MLSLPNDGRYTALDMTPEQRRQKTLEAFGSQVEALSCSTPVLMIFEDAHWTVPTSLEAVSRAVDRIRVDLVNQLEQEKAAGRTGRLSEKLLRHDLAQTSTSAWC